jgi:CubicO group peptidase (beta-lactamase class C family)
VRGLVALAQLVAARADAGTDEANASKVDRLFEEWNSPNSPGCALGIVRDGKLIVARGYGIANLDHDVPITPTSVFEVGSMSKSFCGKCPKCGECVYPEELREAAGER